MNVCDFRKLTKESGVPKTDIFRLVWRYWIGNANFQEIIEDAAYVIGRERAPGVAALIHELNPANFVGDIRECWEDFCQKYRNDF